MVDPKTNSLLLLYDDAQSIYSKKSQLDFSLSSVGVQARGRTTVLKLNYRYTNEILGFAYRFASRYLNPDVKDEDNVPLVQPEAVGRHGPPPVVKTFNNYEEEASYIARIFQRMHDEQGIRMDSLFTGDSQAAWLPKEFSFSSGCCHGLMWKKAITQSYQKRLAT